MIHVCVLGLRFGTPNVGSRWVPGPASAWSTGRIRNGRPAGTLGCRGPPGAGADPRATTRHGGS